MRKPVVLIACSSHDPNRVRVQSALSHLSGSVRSVWLGSAVDERNFGLTWELKSSGRESLIRVCGEEIHADEIGAIWSRGISYRGRSTIRVGTAENFALSELIHSTNAFWGSLRDRFWMNSRESLASTNRLDQLVRAREVGFRTPDTIVSSDAETLNAFISSYRQCIVKRVSQGGPGETGPGNVFTTLLPEGTTFVDPLVAPVLLQELINKRCEIRATVVGDRVFAGSLDTNADERTKIDSRLWIRTNLSYSSAYLSEDECERLVLLNQRLGYEYSAVDLIRMEDGELCYLESNPAGQWSFLELQTGFPITHSIAVRLAEKATRGP